MQQRYPEPAERSVEAMEGDAAHWALACMLRGDKWPDVGDIAPNRVVITEEMLLAADTTYDRIYALCKKHGVAITSGHVEERLPLPRIHPAAFGTPDYWVWLIPGRLLLVADFKYGHRFVSARENQQLVEYTSGIVESLDDQVTVIAAISQPRAYHPEGSFRTWVFKAFEIRAQVNQGSNAAHEALGSNPRTRAGPECRDCTARAHCVTFLRAAYSDIEMAGSLETHEVPLQSMTAVRRQVEGAIQRLEALLKGLDQVALSHIKAGKSVPGLTVVNSKPREKWDVPVAQIELIGKMLGLRTTKLEPITPQQARDAGVPADVVNSMSSRPTGSATLTYSDELADRVFK